MGETGGMLMESWPDDPEDGILASALRAMAFGRPVESYPDGTYIVKKGDPFDGTYKLEQGCVEIELWEGEESDTDEDTDEVQQTFAKSSCTPTTP